MGRFNLNEYEMVEDRLKLFWADYPKGRIETNVVHITDDGTSVTIKAEIFTDVKEVLPISTGIAQETKGQGGPVNKDAWAENCETSAIGRALANWKYQGKDKKRPSREEMSKVGNETSEPAPQVKASPTPVSNPVKKIADAGYGDKKNDKHPNGKLAMDSTGLLCPCDNQCPVKYYTEDEKTSPRSPDFRCTMMGNCVGGDTVDGKVFAKSWWMDNKQTPDSWKDYASVSNGMTLPKPKSLDEIGPDDAPF
jgi:hypothetical protein